MFLILSIVLAIGVKMVYAQPISESAHLERKLKTASLAESVEIMARLVALYRQAQPKRANLYGEKALKLLEKYPDDELKTTLLNDLCWTNLNLSAIKTAFVYVEKGIALARETGNQKGLAYLLKNRGNIHYNIKNYKRAMEDFVNAQKLFRIAKDKVGIAICYNNIGLIHWKQKNYPPGLEAHRKCQAILEPMGDTYSKGISLLNSAVIYTEQEEYKRSLDYLNRSLVLLQKFEAIGNLAVVYQYFAQNYKQMGQISMALEYAEKALTLAKNANYSLPLRDITRLLYEIHAINTNFEMAYKYHLEFKEYNDRFFSDENKQKILDVEIKYQSEKKMETIAILEKEKHIRNLEINKQRYMRDFLLAGALLILIILLVIYNRFLYKKKINAILNVKKRKLKELIKELTDSESNLKESVASRDKFFSIIAHDLRAPISAFFESIETLSVKFHNFSTKEIKAFINEINISAERLFNLLENLLQWSSTKKGDIRFEPKNFDLSFLAWNNVKLLKRNAAKKNITLTSNIRDKCPCFADENMVAAIFRNLLTNSIKFTHPGGNISIDVRDTENDTVEVSVSDSGIGIKPGDVEKLFRIDIHYTTCGTSSEMGTGLGLALCKEFVEKNNGRINVASEPGKGSTFFFTLPSSSSR